MDFTIALNMIPTSTKKLENKYKTSALKSYNLHPHTHPLLGDLQSYIQ